MRAEGSREGFGSISHLIRLLAYRVARARINSYDDPFVPFSILCFNEQRANGEMYNIARPARKPGPDIRLLKLTRKRSLSREFPHSAGLVYSRRWSF